MEANIALGIFDKCLSALGYTLLFLLFAACSRNHSPTQSNQSSGFTPGKPAADIFDIAQLNSAASLLSDLSNRVNALEMTNLLKSITENEWVDVDMRSKGYQKIPTALLPLLITAVDASPYMDGYRVTLALGNPYSITFNGLSMDVITHSIPFTATNYQAYSASAVSNHFELTDRLLPGEWTDVQLDFAPLSTSALHDLWVKITLGQIEAPHRSKQRSP